MTAIKLRTKIILCLFTLFLSSCGAGESGVVSEVPTKPKVFIVQELRTTIPIPSEHKYNKVENTDPYFRKKIIFGDLTLFLYGSWDEGRIWWNEVHPYFPVGEDQSFYGMYAYTGKHQVWFPVKVDEFGMIYIQPYSFAHEFTHFLAMLDEQILDADKWGY